MKTLRGLSGIAIHYARYRHETVITIGYRDAPKMPETVNKIKNANFSEGTEQPRSWSWVSDTNEITWARAPQEDGSSAIEITSTTAQGSACFLQPVRVKQSAWYRVEVVVTGDLNPDCDGSAVLRVLSVDKDREELNLVTLAEMTRSCGPHTLRAYFQTAGNARTVLLQIGVQDIAGSLTVHSASFVDNIEPDSLSHPLALPPPPHACPAPRKVSKILVCDDDGEDRPLTAMLKKRFGRRAVTHAKAGSVKFSDVKADAVIIAGDKPLAGARTLSALERLAEQCIVVVSMTAFARVAGDGIETRTIEQSDDPLHACVREGNFITRGFALEDIFPFATKDAHASGGSDHLTMTHRQFRKTGALTALIKKRGYLTVLESMTDRENTSHVPMCLYKPTEHGGLIVYDVEAVETLPTNRDEPNLAAFLLLNMLGTDQVSLGQYVVPLEMEKDFCALIKEFAIRYLVFEYHGQDRNDMLLTLGKDTESVGLPIRERPLILLRSGLRGDDMAGIYGTFFYLKNLVRPDAYGTSYARDLVSRFRIAWAPLASPWQGEFWDDELYESGHDADGEFERGSIAAVIDVTDCDTNSPRVAFSGDTDGYRRSAETIPELAKAFGASSYFYRTVPRDVRLSCRSEMEWRFEDATPEVTVDPSAFDTPLHHHAAAAGAELIRIDVPASCGDFVANSIWRTDFVATTLEHVVGLQYGLLAMNRRSRPVAYDGHPPLKSGEAINEPPGEGGSRRAARAG